MYSLRNKLLRASLWTFVGYGISQVLRLASNLILTRLLAPEHFGLMALVNVLIIGLNMMSDVGIGPNIIQSEHGTQRNFLNTAWTIQIVRGFGIWLICLIIAWPFSIFYSDPIFVWLIPAMGVVAIINGFNSTNIHSVGRDIKIGRLTILEIASQFAALIFMTSIAYYFPSVWVLVFGAIVSAVVKMVGSHFWLARERNMFCVDIASVRELFGFGRWVFLSTILSFLINTSGSLVLGKFITKSELGLFVIATTLAKVVENIFSQFGNQVFLPAYAQIKTLSMTEIKIRVAKLRVAINLLFIPPLWLFVVYGQELIDILFDSRYHEAGWIFRIYALGIIFTIVPGIGPFYLALGNSSLAFKLELFRFLIYFASMVAGWFLYGVNGIIVGMALHSMLMYGVNVFAQYKYRVWTPRIDLIMILISVIVIGYGLYLKGCF